MQIMKAALVIFNGIKFPYYLIEYALTEAKQQQASVHALFLKAKKEVSEGYGFPSDFNQAENVTDINDALEDDIRIINHHMKLATDMAQSEGVACTNELITECSLEDILKITETFDIVYIDGAYDDENTSMLSNNRFKLADLMKRASSPVKLVYEM